MTEIRLFMAQPRKRGRRVDMGDGKPVETAATFLLGNSKSSVPSLAGGVLVLALAALTAFSVGMMQAHSVILRLAQILAIRANSSW